MISIRTNNDSYKDRNKNKISTLIGKDAVFLDILSLEFETSEEEKLTLKELLEKIFSNQEELVRLNEMLSKEILNLNSKITELKKALKEYIDTENIVDTANTNSIEILSEELAKCNLRLKELEEKTKYL